MSKDLPETQKAPSGNLPAFRRSVGVTPAPAVNVQAPFDELSKVLGDFTQGVTKLATRAATERAAQEGAEAGAAPDFKGDLAPGITAPTAAFNRAALAANKMQNQTSITTSIHNIHDAITSPESLTINKNPLVTFDKEIGAFGDEFLSKVPKQNLQAARNYFQYIAGNARRSVAQQEHTIKVNALAEGYQQNQNLLQHLALTAVFNGDILGGTGLIGQRTQNSNEAVISGIVSQQQVDNSTATLLPKLQQNTTLGQFNRMLNAGTPKEIQDFITKFEKSKSPDMNFLQRGDTLAKLLGMQGLHQQANENREKVLESKFENWRTQVQQGGFVDPQLAAELPVTNARLAAKFAPQLEKARVYNTVMTQLRWATPSQRTTMLASAKQFVGGDLTITGPQQFFSSLERASEGQMKKFKDDPFAYVENNPAVRDAVSSLELSTIANAQLDNPGTGLTLPKSNAALLESTLAPLNTDPVKTSLDLQKKLGAKDDELRVMSKPAAAEFVTNISGEAQDVQLREVQSLLLTFPNHPDIALRNLNEAKLDGVTQTALSASNNPLSRRFVPDMIAANAQTPQETKDTKAIALTQTGLQPKDFANDIQTQLKDYLTTVDNAPTKIAAIKQVTDLSYYLVTVKNQSETEAVKNASDAVVNNNFNFVSQHGNPPLRVRKDQDQNNIARMLPALISQSEGKQLEIPAFIIDKNPKANNEQLHKIYREDILANGHLQSNPATNGVILVGPEGVPVLDTDGNFIAASYADSKNPDSEVSKFMTTNPIPNLLLNLPPLISPKTVAALQISALAQRGVQPDISQVAFAKDQISLGDVTQRIQELAPQAGKVATDLARKIWNSLPKRKKDPSVREFLKPVGEQIDRAIQAFRAKEAKLTQDEEQDKLVRQLTDELNKRKK